MLRILACCLLVFSASAVEAKPAEKEPSPQVLLVWGARGKEVELVQTMNMLGWAYTTVSIRDINRYAELLTTRKVDLVVTGTLLNEEVQADLRQSAQLWREWLAAGGGLVVHDCTSQAVTERWLNPVVGKIEEANSQSVLAKNGDMARPMPLTDDAPSSGFNSLPNALTPILAEIPSPTVWSSFLAKSPGWKSAVSDPDGKSVLMTKHMDSGLVVLSKFMEFGTPGSSAVHRGLLENTWLELQCVREKITLERATTGPDAPAIAITNGRQQRIFVRAGAAGKKIEIRPTQAKPIPVSTGNPIVVENESGKILMSIKVNP